MGFEQAILSSGYSNWVYQSWVVTWLFTAAQVGPKLFMGGAAPVAGPPLLLLHPVQIQPTIQKGEFGQIL